MNFMSFSTMDYFDIAYCTYRKVPKQKIGGWIDFHANGPPPTPTGTNLQNVGISCATFREKDTQFQGG